MVFITKQAASIVMGIVLACIPFHNAKSNPPPINAVGLEQSLLASHWNNSMFIYFELPISETLPVLKRLSEENLVMAQWMYANSLARMGQQNEASKFLYRASLGTRLDATSCKSRETENVEGRFVSAFQNNFKPIRDNAAVRTVGIREAIAYYSRPESKSKNAEWVCYMLANEKRIVLPRQLANKTERVGKRKAVMAAYKDKTGLDFSRSPDYFKIQPVE